MQIKILRSFNAVFGRLVRNASCELIVHLLSLKCMPILLYGLEASTLNNSDIRTLQHPVNNAFMKIFNTTSNDVVHECHIAFGFHTLREQVYMRKIKFLTKYIHNDNLICSFLEHQAISEIRALRVGFADKQRI